MNHIISVLVENKSGVLAKISGLFSRRGFNIESLAVAPTEDERISRITIVVNTDIESMEQVTKQLHKLINVLKIQKLDPANSVQRELVLIKINSENKNRSEIMEIVNIFRANVVDVTKNSMMLELTGTETKINAFEELLKPYGILEFVRTGMIAVARGKKS
ncbi:MAG: acetolactate synthase small subunit [Actinobacteria bacterium]|nr:acetolactate synthase small subunit [Actinomycetota bacterium]